MLIWSHENHVLAPTLGLVEVSDCMFCDSPLVLLGDRPPISKNEIYCLVHTCPVCGWWTLEKRDEGRYADRYSAGEWSVRISGAAGCLRNLDAVDLRISIDEIKTFLNTHTRSEPQFIEQVVAGVLESSGFQTFVSSFSPNGTLLIFHDSLNKLVGVLVRQMESVFLVEQVTCLSGVLNRDGNTLGVYVATSSSHVGSQESTFHNNFPLPLPDYKKLFDSLVHVGRS